MPGRPTRELEEQRAALRTLCKAGKTATEVYDILCMAHGNGAMSRRQVFKVFKEFKEGRTDFKSQTGKHTTRPVFERTEENVAKIKKLIEEDARLTYKELSALSGLGKNVVQNIVSKDLGFTKKCARWVPRLLTDEHKAQHLQMARDWLRRLQADPEFKNKVGFQMFRMCVKVKICIADKFL